MSDDSFINWPTDRQLTSAEAEKYLRNPPKLNGGAKVWSLDTGAPLDASDEKPLQWLDMSTWDSAPIPERKWAIKDRVPLNQAGLFSGEGGAGKSIIELMKNVAHVAGKDWLGSLPEPGPAIYIGAEDDADELRLIHCPGLLLATRLIGLRSMPSRCICRRWRWWLAARSPF
jgi:hypothetical protein